MKFVVAEGHVKRQNRNSIWLVLFLLLVVALLIAMAVSARKWTDFIVPAIGIFFVGNTMWSMFKKFKEGAASYPVVNLDESKGALAIAYKDVSISLGLNQLTNLRLQYRSRRLQSVVTHTDAMGTLRFEGYEQLELLADVLKKYVPPEKVTTASFYHR